MKKLKQDIADRAFEPVYLIWGPEGYLRRQARNALRKALTGDDDLNYTYREGKVDPAEIRDIAMTVPFFAEKRLIVLENTGLVKKGGEELADLLEKGMDRAGDTPVLLINEPMLISSGENSEIRYNYYYPREAYDSWHEALQARAEAAGWNLLDLWDVLENEAFTNSAIHYSAESAGLLAELVAGQIEVIAGNR